MEAKHSVRERAQVPFSSEENYKKRDNFQQTVASDPQADKICILVTSYFSRFLVHSVFLIKDAEILFQSFHSLFHN